MYGKPLSPDCVSDEQRVSSAPSDFEKSKDVDMLSYAVEGILNVAVFLPCRVAFWLAASSRLL
jgi:hypothetical protein